MLTCAVIFIAMSRGTLWL